MRTALALVLSVWVLVSCGTARVVGHSDGTYALVNENRSQRERSDLWKGLTYGYESVHFQQEGLKLVDPLGDAYLIRRLDTIPAKLFKFLVREPLPQTDGAAREGELAFQIGKTLPFDIERLLNQCGQIMLAHYPAIYPTLGEEHKWSPEARRYLLYGFWHRLWRYSICQQQNFPLPLLQRSKLFLCLACGWTSRYCVTGQEQALTERILQYPDRENVLAGEPHRKGRENDPLQRKLAYIRHDSKELGDNYGAWYHFFGIALYGMLRPELVSRFVAGTESLGSFFYEGSDKQETLINRYGAIFGARLREMIDEGTWGVPPRIGGPTDYMLPNEML